MRKISNLSELLEALRTNDPSVLDHHGQWSSSLPTFGGADVEDTIEVHSWDETHMIVGTCADDLEIVERGTR